MISAANMTELVRAMKRLQPQDELQGIAIFESGVTDATFTYGSIRFQTFKQVEALIEYQAALRQGIDGEGI